MDGSGKSTAGEVARAELEARGRLAELAWARPAAESHLLDRLSRPAKSLVRRRRSIADRLAAGGSVEAAADGGPAARASTQAPGTPRPPASLLATPVDAAWVALVGLLAVRAHRRAARRRRTGMSVVCDPWRTIDAVTAGRRKPGDQAQVVLERMEHHYVAAAARTGAQVVDARRLPAEIAADIRTLVDAALPTAHSRPKPGVR